MPQSATPNMLLVEPSEDGDADVWDTIFTTLFARIDLHDHTTGLGVKIPSAGINPNADLMFASSGTNYAITDLLAIDFAPVAAAAVTAYASALYVDSATNNLFFKNQAGTAVQITDGNELNVSIVGGWGGDYASVGALADFDDATDTMRFRQELATSVRQFSKVAFSDIKLYEYLAAGVTPVPSNVITIKSPAALAASYSFTLPSAVPASQQIMQMTAAGILTPSNTIPENVTLAVDKSITLSGLGRIKHGTWKRGKIADVAAIVSGTVSYGPTGTGSQSACIMAASTAVWIDVADLLEDGETLTSVVLYTEELTGTANTTFDLAWDRPSIGTFGTSLLSAATTSRATLPTPVTLTPTGYTFVAGDNVRIAVTTAAASTRANISVYANVTRA